MEDINQDVDTSEPAAPAADPVANLKGEFNRKVGNLESQVGDLKKANEALLSQLQQMLTPAAPASTKKVSVFDDEDAYAAKIKDEAKREMQAVLNQENQARAKQANAIADITKEFPEVAKSDHELTQRAVELYNSMSDSDKSSALAYKTAVTQAASELGIKPKSKRAAGDDSFSLGGSSAGSQASTRASKKSDIDPRTEAFAKLVGVDIDNKEIRDRIKNNHGRKAYTNWG